MTKMTQTKTTIISLLAAGFEFETGLFLSLHSPLFLRIEMFYGEHYEVCAYLSLNSSSFKNI